MDCLPHASLSFLDVRAEVAIADVYIDPTVRARVFAANHGRAVRDGNVRNDAQRHGLALAGDHRQLPELFHGVAQLAWIADVDRKALQALDRLRHVFSADGVRDHVLHVLDVESVARCGQPIDLRLDVPPSRDALGER